MKFQLIVAALCVNVSALTPNEVADPSIQYFLDLSCTDCIKSGKKFCVKGTEKPIVDGTTGPETRCCAKFPTYASCPEAFDKDWSCSTDYSDITYARQMCPFNTNYCGLNPSLNFINKGNPAKIEIKNLPRGESCSYTLTAECGAPGFRLMELAALTDSNFDITALTVLNEAYMSQVPSSLDIALDLRKNFPRSSVLPPRKSVPLDPAVVAATGQTLDKSFGFMIYSATAGKYMMYGSDIQSETASVDKWDATEPECTERQLILNVSAKTLLASQQVLTFEVGTYGFN